MSRTQAKPAPLSEVGAPTKYEKIRDLNSGTFGFVQLCKDKTNGLSVAIKFIERGEKITKYVEREIVNHRQLIHPHIVQFKEICDFGYSKSEKFQSAPGSRVGTPAYLAPEVILTTKGKNYDGKPADVWSSGVMLYVMLVGAYPFERPEDKHDSQKLQKMIQRILKVDFKMPSHIKVSDACKDLFSRILVSDPLKRISIEEIYRHPWYTKNLPPGVTEMNKRPMPQPQGMQPEEAVRSIIKEAAVAHGASLGAGVETDEYIDDAMENYEDDPVENAFGHPEVHGTLACPGVAVGNTRIVYPLYREVLHPSTRNSLSRALAAGSIADPFCMSGMKAGQGVARPPPKTPNEASPGPSTPTVEAAGPNKPAAATTKGKCWFIPYEAIIARIFHPQQLRLFDGIGHNPAYMAIVGEVFDVSKEPTLYGNLKYDLNDETENLSNEQLADIFAWREYYRKKYQMKGKLGGPFYKREDGKATKYLARVSLLAQDYIALLAGCHGLMWRRSHPQKSLPIDGQWFPRGFPPAPLPESHQTESSCLFKQAGSVRHAAAEPKDALQVLTVFTAIL
eukprot:gene21102-27990_t